MVKKTYLSEIKKAIVLNKSVLHLLDNMTDRATDEYDDMSVELQCSAKGELLENVINLIDAAVETAGELNHALSELEEAIA